MGLTSSDSLYSTVAIRLGLDHGIFCPGIIRGEFATRWLQERAEANRTTIEIEEKSGSPMQRLLEPEEVSDLAVYLASDAARGITGQSMNVNGGSIMD